MSTSTDRFKSLHVVSNEYVCINRTPSFKIYIKNNFRSVYCHQVGGSWDHKETIAIDHKQNKINAI